MNCYKAIYLWMGAAAAEALIEPLKEAQKVQLKKDFEALAPENEKKEYRRKTRTEQEQAKEAALDEAINAAAEEEKEEAVDVYDLSAPQDILGQFNGEWTAATLALAKWQEKKDAMQAVITAADVPKLAPGDYSGLFEVTKKMVGDSMVAVG